MPTEISELQIPVDQLELGMRVIRLDRPWIETDFLLQGFVIQAQDDIDALIRQCQHVFIEVKIETVKKKANRRKESKGLFARFSNKPQKTDKPKNVYTGSKKHIPSASQKVTYINKINTEKELPRASADYSSAKFMVKNIMEGIRIGNTLDINQARQSVNLIVDGILRNKDALSWLTKIKEKDEYTAEHSLNVCILSTTFARHLGHEEYEIREIALCGLLHDVGKSKIPAEILNKEGRFTEEEYLIMKEHTTYGRNLLMSLKQDDRIAIDVAHSHHERMDGKGYPRGLVARQIPYYAKIIGITDCYDAITSNRCYDKARASMDALDIIYQCKGGQFDEELALEFIKCIGIYPPGSVVQLTNGEVGIIISTDENNKLRPKILLVRNKLKKLCREKIIDLNKQSPINEEARYLIAPKSLMVPMVLIYVNISRKGLYYRLEIAVKVTSI